MNIYLFLLSYCGGQLLLISYFLISHFLLSHFLSFIFPIAYFFFSYFVFMNCQKVRCLEEKMNLRGQLPFASVRLFIFPSLETAVASLIF